MESVPWRGQAQVGSVCLAVSLAHDGFGFECAVGNVDDVGDDVFVAVDCGCKVVFSEQSVGRSGASASDFVCTGSKCHRSCRA